MRPFEVARLCAEPFLPVLHGRVRRRLVRLAKEVTDETGRPARVLDIGGRKSHYTIGVPAEVTITDLPRRTVLQEALNLGMTDEIARQTITRRSNIARIVIDDMTESGLPDDEFDIAVAVEVLEHVEEDARFLDEVRRVLIAGGIYVMTTPNGDWVENTSLDHKRHYTRESLERLLAERFEDVRVQWAIRDSPWRSRGLASWSVRHPGRTLASMAGNVVSWIQSADETLANRPAGTRNLIAEGRKAV